MKSVEVRWFFDNQEEKKISDKWFTDIGGKLYDQEVRTDFYLPRTYKSSLGIKLRNYNNDTNIEIKEKIHGIDLPELSGIGNAEHWNKWSFSLDSADESVRMIVSGKLNWIKINKSRSTVKYEILPENKYRIIDKDVDSACIVELAEIKIKEKSFCTIGFEAFRKDENDNETLGNLNTIFNKIISSELLQILKPENSFGYPGFIERYCL